MKMERFNEILNKLMQMEDAEENLEMVPLYEEVLPFIILWRCRKI